MTIKFLSLLISSSILPAFVLCDAIPLEEPKENCFQEEFCGCEGQPYRVEARHIEAGGIGYDKGYSSLDFFAAPFRNCTFIPFVDLRGHVLNNGKLAANAGLGVRTLWGSFVYGVNAYYDYRKTQHFHYNQVGLGLEALGARWEFRANGYLPVGQKESGPFNVSSSTDFAFSSFSGNNMILQETTSARHRNEFALRGVDGEAGYYFLKCKNYNAYLGLGPYYYHGKHDKHAFGGRARLAVNITEYITLECINTYDSLYHERVQGRVRFNLPFGPKKSASTQCDIPSCRTALALNQRLFQSVERQEIIPVKKHHTSQTEQTFVTAIDPSTNLPFNFIFVDNTSSSNGTFESPFSTLLAAQTASKPGDIIYVFPGDKTDKGMNLGINLQDNQRFLGSATPHDFNTTDGIVTVPALSTYMPNVSNRGQLDGTVIPVSMANNNEVSGFNINNLADPNIAFLVSINCFQKNNAQINHNIINSTTDGIDVNNFTGTIIINDNFISGDALEANIGGGADGIAVGQSTGNSFVSIFNNSFSGFSQSGIHVFSSVNSPQMSVSLISNSMINCQQGILTSNNSHVGNLNVDVSNNFINSVSDNFALTGTIPTGVFVEELNVPNKTCVHLSNNTVFLPPTALGAYTVRNLSATPSNLTLIFEPNNTGNVRQFPGSQPFVQLSEGTCP